MTSILFGSIVRDGESYLQRYFDQINSLTPDYHVGLIITEGDSTDNTKTLLQKLVEDSNFPTVAYEYNHKGQKFGSVDNPSRWFNIATTWNFMLEQSMEVFDNYDYFCYMEADLIWNKQTIDLLVDGLNQYDCVAPMSMLHEIFYDTWGHRSNGSNFQNLPPFHSDFYKYGRYMPLTSAGSCILMKTEVIKNCRLSLVDAMIGHDIVKQGYSFMLDKMAVVNHP